LPDLIAPFVESANPRLFDTFAFLASSGAEFRDFLTDHLDLKALLGDIDSDRRVVRPFTSLIAQPLRIELVESVFGAGAIEGQRLSLFLWIIVQCPDCLDRLDPSAVVRSILSAIASGDLQPALLALSLLFHRGDALAEVDFRQLFELIPGDDPRVTAAVFLCLARAIEQGANITALCHECITIPADFLPKRECARCICHVILNADGSDIDKFTRIDWVDLMYEILEMDDCEFGVLILRAFCKLAENEATRQMVDFEKVEGIADAGSHPDVAECCDVLRQYFASADG
jgi:hypothetical protein